MLPALAIDERSTTQTRPGYPQREQLIDADKPAHESYPLPAKRLPRRRCARRTEPTFGARISIAVSRCSIRSGACRGVTIDRLWLTAIAMLIVRCIARIISRRLVKTRGFGWPPIRRRQTIDNHL